MKIKNFVFLTIAGIINALGVTIFLAPVKLYDSGISGTSMLISQVTPDWISLSLTLLILNIPIFLFGFKKQGINFTIYSIYVISIYSLGAFLICDVLPIDVSVVSPLAKEDLFLCSLFGGVISGVGSGLAIKFGGAMDGLDVISVSFAKKIGLSIGTFNMIYNVILYIICGIVISSWILPLYSIVSYAAGSKTIDFLVDGLDRSKAAIIVTSKPKEISQVLSDTFSKGVTTINAKGQYSDNTSMIYFVMNNFQVSKVKEIVHEIDPKAFITVNDVSDVFLSNNDIG